MKKSIVIVILACILATCNNVDDQCKSEVEVLRVENQLLRDSISNYVPDTIMINQVDTVMIETESGYLAKLQIERIRHYVNISESRPANKKYFFGWVKRTVSE